MRKTERQKKFDKLILKLYDLWKIDNGFVCIIYTAINHMNFTEVINNDNRNKEFSSRNKSKR